MIFFFVLILTFTTTTTTTTTTVVNNRRTLHQPFFPLDSPSTPPPSTDVPFTPNPTPTTPSPSSDPFFQQYPSPPPPSLTSTPSASFPANISSLNLPNSPKSKGVSAKLIATAVTLVIAAVIILAVVVYLRVMKRRRYSNDSTSVSDQKTYRSDSSNNNNNNNNNNIIITSGGSASNNNIQHNNNNNNRIPKLTRPSQSSAEFLYLGTIVNSRNGLDATNGIGINNRRDGYNDNDNNNDNNNVKKLRKLDSPELRPLPPLASSVGGDRGRNPSNLSTLGNHNNNNNSFENGEVESSKDGEYDEEFYSPRGSIGTGSGSRRTFSTGVPMENYESGRIIESGLGLGLGLGSGSGSGSSSCSSSSSGSPVRSVSLSISPPISLSPIRSRPKSPELVALQTAPPTRSPPPPPPPPPQNLAIPSPEIGWLDSLSDLHSPPSPPPTTVPPLQPQNFAIPLLGIGLSDSSSDQNSNSPPPPSRIPPPPPPSRIPPPPPPPPPPPKHWESQSPKTPTPAIRPPVLVTPARPVPVPVINDQQEVSPIEPLPENQENLETPKPKLKPLHWDKVRASSDREMVWDQLKSSSFKLNEEMIETLFIVKTPNSSNSNETNHSVTKRPILPSPMSQENRVLDPKKSQNIAISLRALNVTIEEVCDALLEGNADTLGTELLESLLKMAPTKEEERKLKEYKDDTPAKLGPAEKFLKAVLDVPFAFKRVEAMLYISNFESEVEYLKRSFQTLEAACEELRNSRMFLKLLEAVLKTGNRMNVGTNRGDAHAFKLDTLLKLIDVKGTDGKTTLLHFVVQEIIKSEGARLSNPDSESPTVANDTKARKLGLQVVAGISSELSNVKKAAAMDSDVLNSDVTKLSKGISDISQVVRLNETLSDGVNRERFSESMNAFMKTAEEEIIKIQAQESVAFSLVKEITEYFHGNSAKEEAHPLRIFMVVRDFLTVLDRVCKEVGSVNERIVISSAHKFPVPINPTLLPVFTRQFSSSDDESNSSFQLSS